MAGEVNGQVGKRGTKVKLSVFSRTIIFRTNILMLSLLFIVVIYLSRNFEKNPIMSEGKAKGNTAKPKKIFRGLGSLKPIFTRPRTIKFQLH